MSEGVSTNGVLTLRHSVHIDDTDLRGRLSLRALCELLQESGARHATDLGVGAAALGPRGFAWVLVQWSVEIESRDGERPRARPGPDRVPRRLTGAPV